MIRRHREEGSGSAECSQSQFGISVLGLPEVSERIKIQGGDPAKSQRSFASVTLGGLSTTLLMSISVLPALSVWFAGPNDVLPSPGEGFE